MKNSVWVSSNDMPLSKKIMQGLRDYAPYFLWLAGVSIALLNIFAYVKLSPIEQNLSVMAAEISEIKRNVATVEDQHNDFIRKDTFNQVVVRLDHISNRLDQVYAIVAQRK